MEIGANIPVLSFSLFRKLWLVSHLSVAAARAGGSPVTCQQMCLMMTDPGTQYFLQLTKVVASLTV